MNLNQRFIQHKNSLDVCLLITHCFDYGHGLSLKGEWWNMGYAASWPLGISKRLNLAKEIEHKGGKAKKGCIKEWEVLNGQSVCLRKGEWVSL